MVLKNTGTQESDHIWFSGSHPGILGLSWTKRQHDVHRGSEAPSGSRPGESSDQTWHLNDPFPMEHPHGMVPIVWFHPLNQGFWFLGGGYSILSNIGGKGLTHQLHIFRPHIGTSHCGGIKLAKSMARFLSIFEPRYWVTLHFSLCLRRRYMNQLFLSDCICIFVENV